SIVATEPDSGRSRRIGAIDDYNGRLTAEFRANEGKVGGHWEGRDLLLLTQATRLPIFGEYQEKAGERVIPVVALARR
ncbi:MAG TPA: hypothetical protein VKP14_08090, partial [Gaiellaceae bacterium]|nr:hypothetical protein [Gaiellaceae bacterium]